MIPLESDRINVYAWGQRDPVASIPRPLPPIRRRRARVARALEAIAHLFERVSAWLLFDDSLDAAVDRHPSGSSTVRSAPWQ